MTRTAIDFPFVQHREYRLDDLSAFEDQIANVRRTDSQLSAELRAPSSASLRWVKQRNDELIPLSYFSRHCALSGQTKFSLTDPGNPVDIRLISPEGSVTDLQLTVADPSWDSAKNPGYERRLSLELLNQRGGGTGIGPFKRQGNEIVGNEGMISTADLERALIGGLVKTFTKKTRQVGTGCDLLVFARAYSELISAEKFRSLIGSIPSDQFPQSFDHTYVFDGPEGFFFARNR